MTDKPRVSYQRVEVFLCRFWWHDWGKWEPYTWHGYRYVNPTGAECTGYKVECTEERQKRGCRACGIAQDKKVRG